MATQIVFMPPPPMLIVVPVRRYHPPPFSYPFVFHHQQQQDKRRQNFLQQQVIHQLVQQEQKIRISNFNNSLTKSRWMASGNINIMKLNTDGSSKGNPGPSSFGGLIRDAKGKWLCGYMGKMDHGKPHSSLEAEIWSIFKGLCLIKKKNLSNLLIETDCETILRLRPESFEKDHRLKKVMEDIDTIKTEQKCVLVHTRRDGNQSADLLANLGGRQSDEYVFLEEPPAVLVPYLIRDTESAAEFEKSLH